MLTISKALNSDQAQSYHQLEFTSKSQNYYQQCDAVKGEWQGKLAVPLDLTGAVSAEQFARLADGKHPQTEEQLVRHRAAHEYRTADGTTIKAVEHRAGWDATFSAPKSVSLTALVGGDERVQEAHRAAVTIALDELERYTQARIGGNHPAETTGRFIAAKFDHDTARPVDGYAAPQLHTHAVIFNLTVRVDGSARALQERAFFESQQYATAVYQSTLTYQLRNLGYEIESGKSGAPEIKGYSQQYLDASSPRSQQIKAQMDKTGYSGPEAAEIAAHSTRDRKQTLTPEQVLAAHKHMAAEFGNQPQQVVAAARARALHQDRRLDCRTPAKEAVTFERESIFEREAVADERMILRDALRRGMGETTYQDIRAEFDRREQAGEFRSVQGDKYSSGRSFTTAETIAAERANVRYVLDGQNAVTPMMSAEQAREQANTRSFLNDSQRKAIAEVLSSADRIHGLQGLAGTGKTTTLEVIREGAEAGGYTVEGFAPTSKAAGQLRDAGIDGTTLQSFLARGHKHPSANAAGPHLYMLDESSLASTRQMQAFLDRLNSDDRVLVIGDTRQHQGVDAGRPFEQMQEAGMRTSQLGKIMRQKDPQLLKAVQHLATNETVKGIAMLVEQGRVTEIRNARDRIAAIARDYAARPEGTIIVSPDNRSRQEINVTVRSELLANGTLANDGQTFRTLAHRSDMTGADRTWAARYNPGDVLQYTTGSRAEGIERGSFARVGSVDARGNTLTVELDNGSHLTYDPRRLRGVNVFRETSREFATGDRIQFTAPNKELGVANRDLGTITCIDNGRMSVRMDGKTARTVIFDSVEFRQLDHGYAVTSHSSQGLTTSYVLANIDTDSSRSLINTRLAYVAISRASDDARIYTNNAETLGERLATDIAKTAAVDFRQQSASEQTRAAVAAFCSNNPDTANALLQQHSRVYEYANSDHRLAAVALDYAAHADRAVIIAPDAAERRELTQLIRAELQAEGTLARESRAVPVLVKQEIQNPQLVSSYATGDQIHYKLGRHGSVGIPHNSAAVVLEIDATRNLLTVETRDGEQISYNPSQLRQQTAQSTIYREETRELAAGDRIQFTAPDRENRIRTGDFATVERLGENNALSVRLDNGHVVDLEPEKARHIDHGYAVETAQHIFADRILLTGESSQIVAHQEALSKLNPNIHDLAFYTSDSAQLLENEVGMENAAGPAPGNFSNNPSLRDLSEPIASIEMEGYGISM